VLYVAIGIGCLGRTEVFDVDGALMSQPGRIDQDVLAVRHVCAIAAFCHTETVDGGAGLRG